MESTFKKITTLSLLTCVALLASGGLVSASDFNLAGMNAVDIQGMQYKIKAAPAPQSSAADTIGVDASIRIPFKTIKKMIVLMTESNKDLKIIKAADPVLVRSGEFLKVMNIRVNLNGVIVEPVVTLKPYFEAQDKLAIKIQRVQLHVSMLPTPGTTSAPTAIPTPADRSEPEFNREGMMASIILALTDGINGALKDALAANGSPLKASDIVDFKYDKAAWTLHAKVSTSSIKRYLPDGFMGDLHMTGLSFNNSAIFIKFQTEQ
ncbi:MAG TPA: hypothetical protein DCL44_00770 [Elusimicrobia bacterium]|nr:hypothetical protein [Elusimicrobiota bacterium]